MYALDTRERWRRPPREGDEIITYDDRVHKSLQLRYSTSMLPKLQIIHVLPRRFRNSYFQRSYIGVFAGRWVALPVCHFLPFLEGKSESFVKVIKTKRLMSKKIDSVVSSQSNLKKNIIFGSERMQNKPEMAQECPKCANWFLATHISMRLRLNIPSISRFPKGLALSPLHRISLSISTPVEHSPKCV